MSKVTAYYHIVFCTKYREMTINPIYEEDLYRFITHQVKSMRSDMLRIGGIANHIHMLINLSPTIALANLMQKVKGLSSGMMKGDSRFPYFIGWAEDYYASTLSPSHRNSVRDYIINQKVHHQQRNLDDEFIRMYRFADLPYDERDLR